MFLYILLSAPGIVLIISAIIVIAGLLFYRRRKSDVTHAGGLVYKMENGKRVYLVITSSRDSRRWVLPKGHIERHETAKAAAIREVAEETGILATPQRFLGFQQYVKGGEKVCVKYYLMKYVHDASPSNEKRRLLWLSREEAIQQLTFRDTKKIVERV